MIRLRVDKQAYNEEEDAEEAEDDFELPAAVKLTGNKDFDDDIIGFYKAKTELMAR